MSLHPMSDPLTLSAAVGVLDAARGGTGQSSYTIGDLLYASASTTLSKLAAVATGNALISGGVGAAPSWGKIALTTHVSGILPSANGGTGVNNAGTLTNASNTTITGGGTIALGGFTLTIPATGTAMLLSETQTVTGAKTFSAVTNFSNTAASTSTSTGSVISAGGYAAAFQSFFRGVASSGDVSVLAARFFANQSVDPAAFRFALDFQTSTSGATAGNSSVTVGIQSDFQHDTAGITHADVRAFSAILNTNTGTSVITNGYGYYFRNGTNSGTCTNKHAFYTEAVSGGTNNYAFRSAGAGLISIGDTTTSASVLLAGGMQFATGKNLRLGTAAIATNATDGFLYVSTCAGTPTGTPTTLAGTAPIVIDTTNHKLYFYSGGSWRDAGP